MRARTITAILIFMVLMLTSCAKTEAPLQTSEPSEVRKSELPQTATETTTPDGVVQETVETIAPEGVAQETEMLSEPPQAALSELLNPEASGECVEQNEKAEIDYSNTADGYVMVRYTAENEKKLKVQAERTGSETIYTYNLMHGEWAVIPLTDGEGTYQIRVYENVRETQYSLVLAVKCDVTLEDEFAPFLRPNQYVNYTDADAAVALARELTENRSQPLECVAAVYDYVVQNLDYDYDKAATVQSGYIPDLDAVLAEKKGICFDYAALMTGMLRSCGIPCKMVFGYAGTIYHAWISVWTEDTGWVDGVIFFDGTAWQRLDPTFAASAREDASILDFIGDGNNYREKYLY